MANADVLCEPGEAELCELGGLHVHSDRFQCHIVVIHLAARGAAYPGSYGRYGWYVWYERSSKSRSDNATRFLHGLFQLQYFYTDNIMRYKRAIASPQLERDTSIHMCCFHAFYHEDLGPGQGC